ncbi:MAG: hypothetical protein HY305_02525 [Sphingobacteriales bacterium]|nr:hypothetical protein [Sphingobacteriales bacterium]
MKIKNKYYLIDHKLLFLFGFVFYLLTPYIVGVTDTLHGFPGMELYHGFFKRIPQNKLTVYIIITLAWFISFYCGHLCFKLARPYKRTLKLFPSAAADYGISYVGLFLLILLFVFTYLGRESLFAGYASYDIGTRGKISTLLVTFNFFLLYLLISQQRISYFFVVIGTVGTVILLLSMGGRMYVFQTLIIILVYKTSFATRQWKGYQIIGVMFAGFIVGLFFFSRTCFYLV